MRETLLVGNRDAIVETRWVSGAFDGHRMRASVGEGVACIFALWTLCRRPCGISAGRERAHAAPCADRCAMWRPMLAMHVVGFRVAASAACTARPPGAGNWAASEVAPVWQASC